MLSCNVEDQVQETFDPFWQTQHVRPFNLHTFIRGIPNICVHITQLHCGIRVWKPSLNLNLKPSRSLQINLRQMDWLVKIRRMKRSQTTVFTLCTACTTSCLLFFSQKDFKDENIDKLCQIWKVVMDVFRWNPSEIISTLAAHLNVNNICNQTSETDGLNGGWWRLQGYKIQARY